MALTAEQRQLVEDMILANTPINGWTTDQVRRMVYALLEGL